MSLICCYWVLGLGRLCALNQLGALKSFRILIVEELRIFCFETFASAVNSYIAMELYCSLVVTPGHSWH